MKTTITQETKLRAIIGLIGVILVASTVCIMNIMTMPESEHTGVLIVTAIGALCMLFAIPFGSKKSQTLPEGFIP